MIDQCMEGKFDPNCLKNAPGLAGIMGLCKKNNSTDPTGDVHSRFLFHSLNFQNPQVLHNSRESDKDHLQKTEFPAHIVSLLLNIVCR
ncbi:hypothetical protein LEP1GSC199_1341 [Leptospira vanthielii serovar Holland str. Waz Holland = ATCC 700522]|uniref:Uncharacterized protein n=1 Tax=Leptospira vanthielii serovar Holland str. Waz Holland = ATCC 700522 TaxID=1218591 RepID=N1WAK8_9LEPT|nr:hypothetical protein LEP1GSC199_1341 [Leptospira vanthielii serovar Holland str. Waz Holland = ATCC 700522]